MVSFSSPAKSLSKTRGTGEAVMYRFLQFDKSFPLRSVLLVSRHLTMALALLTSLVMGCEASQPSPDITLEVSSCTSRVDARTLDAVAALVYDLDSLLEPRMASGEASLLTIPELQHLLSDEQWEVVAGLLDRANTISEQEPLSCDRTEDRDRFVALTTDQGRSFFVLTDARADVQQLLAAATADNVVLTIASAHRNAGYQLFLLLFYLAQYDGCLEEELELIALPRASEHVCSDRQAIDFATAEGTTLPEGGREVAWLTEHAADFGFTLTYPTTSDAGIGSEPWHWCWHPANSSSASNQLDEE